MYISLTVVFYEWQHFLVGGKRAALFDEKVSSNATTYFPLYSQFSLLINKDFIYCYTKRQLKRLSCWPVALFDSKNDVTPSFVTNLSGSVVLQDYPSKLAGEPMRLEPTAGLDERCGKLGKKAVN